MPSSLTIPAPSGVANGDRVVAVVIGQSTSSSPNFAMTAVPAGWTLIPGDDSTNPKGWHRSNSQGLISLFLLTRQWSGAVDSVALTQSGGSGNSYRVHTLAWRPGKPISTNFRSTSYLSSNPVSFSSASITSPTAGYAYAFIQFQASGSMSTGGPTATAFSGVTPTLRVDQAAISGRGGPFRVADLQDNRSSISYASNAWDRSPNTNGFTLSLALSGADSAADRVVSEWGVDRIAW